MSDSPFGNLFDRVKSSAQQARGQMRLAGRIASLKVERSTQKAERERLLKEIGAKTLGLFQKNRGLDAKLLSLEILPDLEHIERIDKRKDEIEQEISNLQSEMMHGDKDVVDADDVTEYDDDDDEEDDDDDEEDEPPPKKSAKSKK